MGKPAEETAPQETVETKSFTDVIGALGQGKLVTRQSWPEGTFVCRQVPSTVPPEVVPNMNSLPEAAKTEFVRRGLPLKYDNQLVKVSPENDIWGYQVPTYDLLAEDWVILN